MLELDFYEKCITTLDRAFKKMTSNEVRDIDYEIYRSAWIKEFEILMEQSGKLLRKVLGQYEHSKKAVDSLTYKDIFRKSVLRGLISVEESDRWMDYRDNRNNTAHDYGENFAEETLKILEQFLIDCKSLAQVITTHKHDS
jgi:nucleotidyltransferase substrate binding protein (TIGR01987 family)